MAAVIPLLVGKVRLSSLTTEDQKPVSRAQGVNPGSHCPQAYTRSDQGARLTDKISRVPGSFNTSPFCGPDCTLVSNSAAFSHYLGPLSAENVLELNYLGIKEPAGGWTQKKSKKNGEGLDRRW